MSASGGTTGSRSRHGRDNDTYEPEQQGVRNIAAHDGYDAGDGFERPNPQLFPNANTTASQASQSSYLPYGSASYDDSARRRSSTGGVDDYEYRRRQNSGYKYGYGYGGFGREYTTPRRNRSAPRGREYVPHDYSDSESDFDYDDDERDRALAKRRASQGRASSRGRSQSNGGAAGIRAKIKDMLEGDDDEMGSGNTQAKKWAATALGAVAGGFAARTAKKDANNWVPTALGAFIGGLTAREAEKVFYLRKDSKEKEEKDELQWEGRRGRH